MKKILILTSTIGLFFAQYIQRVDLDAIASTVSESPTYLNDVYSTNDPFSLDHQNAAFVAGDSKDSKIYGTGYVGEYNSASVYQTNHIFYWNVSSNGSVANSLGTGYKKSNNSATATASSQITSRTTTDINSSFQSLGIYSSNTSLYYYNGSSYNSGTYSASLSSYFASPRDYSFGLNHSLLITNSGNVYSTGYSNGMGRSVTTTSTLSYTGSNSNNTTYSTSTTAQNSVTYVKTSLTNGIGASSGNDHSLVLLSDGSLFAGGLVGVTGLTEDKKTSFAETISKEEALLNGGIKDFKAGFDCSYVLYNNGILLEATSDGWNEVDSNIKLIDIDYDGYLYYVTNDNQVYRSDVSDEFNSEFVVSTDSNIIQIRGGSSHWGYLTDSKELYLYENESLKELIVENVVFFDTGSNTYGYLTSESKLYMYGDSRWIGGTNGLISDDVPYAHLTSDDIDLYSVDKNDKEVKLDTTTTIYSPNKLYIDYSVYNKSTNRTKFQFIGKLYDDNGDVIIGDDGIYKGNEFYFDELEAEFSNEYTPTNCGEYLLIVNQYDSSGHLISRVKSFDFEIKKPKINDDFLSFDNSSSDQNNVVNHIPGNKYYLNLDSVDEVLQYIGSKVSIQITGDEFSSEFVYYSNEEFIEADDIWQYLPSTKSGTYVCIVNFEYSDEFGDLQQATSSSSFTLKIYEYVEDQVPPSTDDLVPPSADDQVPPSTDDQVPPLVDNNNEPEPTDNTILFILLPITLIIGLGVGFLLGKRG